MAKKTYNIDIRVEGLAEEEMDTILKIVAALVYLGKGTMAGGFVEVEDGSTEES